MAAHEVHDYLYYKTSSYISIFLIQEKHNPNSRYKVWLDLLPNAYLDSPLFFTQEEKDLLTGSYFKDVIDEEIEGNEYDFGVLQRQVPGLKEEIQFEEYLQMQVLMWSRVFSMEVNGTETTGMVPFADMPNHDSRQK